MFSIHKLWKCSISKGFIAYSRKILLSTMLHSETTPTVTAHAQQMFPFNAQVKPDAMDMKCLCVIGNEFHYVFACKEFHEKRSIFLTCTPIENPELGHLYHLFTSEEVPKLRQLASFVEHVLQTFDRIVF